MTGGSVRTVLGDVPATELGVTYLHEHLIIDSPLVAEHWPHIHLPDAEAAVGVDLPGQRNPELRLFPDLAGVGAER